MNKKIIHIFIIIFFLGTIFSIFPPADFYSEVKEGQTTPLILTGLFCLGFMVWILGSFLSSKYPNEYMEAHKISHTPHTKYGWYGLIFTIIFFFLFYLYIFLTK